jgi:CheY-like chemotaxis protein
MTSRRGFESGPSEWSVLLVADDDAALSAHARYFRWLGCSVDTASGAEEVESRVTGCRHDLVVFHLGSDDRGASALPVFVRTLRGHNPHACVVVLDEPPQRAALSGVDVLLTRRHAPQELAQAALDVMALSSDA